MRRPPLPGSRERTLVVALPFVGLILHRVEAFELPVIPSSLTGRQKDVVQMGGPQSSGSCGIHTVHALRLHDVSHDALGSGSCARDGDNHMGGRCFGRAVIATRGVAS